MKAHANSIGNVRVVAASFTVLFVGNGIQSYAFGPFLTPMVNELSWSHTEYSFSRSIAFVMMAIVSLLIAPHIDRFQGSKLVFVGGLVLAASVFCSGYVQGIYSWYMLNGVAVTVGAVVAGGLVVNAFMAKWFVINLGKAVAIASMGIALAGILVPPFATHIIDLYGWRESWRIMGMLTAVLAIASSILLTVSKKHNATDSEKSNKGEFGSNKKTIRDIEKITTPNSHQPEKQRDSYCRKEALRCESFYILIFCFGIFSMTTIAIFYFVMPFGIDFEMSEKIASWLLPAAAFSALCSKPMWGWCIDKYRIRILTSLSLFLMSIAVFIAVYSRVMEFHSTFFLSFMIAGMSWGGMVPLQECYFVRLFGPANIGAIRGAAFPYLYTFPAVCTFLIPIYYDKYQSYILPFFVLGLLNILAAILILRIREN